MRILSDSLIVNRIASPDGQPTFRVCFFKLSPSPGTSTQFGTINDAISWHCVGWPSGFVMILDKTSFFSRACTYMCRHESFKLLPGGEGEFDSGLVVHSLSLFHDSSLENHVKPCLKKCQKLVQFTSLQLEEGEL